MQETIIIEGICNRIKGAFVENGHGMLTNQRFIYSKHSLAKMAVMGVLVNLTKGSFDFDIPISNIISIEESKRLFDKILVIKTSDSEYKFYFTKLENWKISFQNVLNTSDITSSIQTPPVSIADELSKFKALLDSGAITEAEYNAQKEKLLN
mgnify:CR=1 FL=1|jgi:hypothetical protein